MPHLYQALATRVDEWRRQHWPCEEFPAIAEILDWASDPDGGTPRYLRLPQLRALETYWYLRLVERTPHVFELYERLLPDHLERLEAWGLATPEINKLLVGQPLDLLWRRIREDDAFVAKHRLESVRETLTLAYPSYILALAMGAGKTVLIGAVFAIEFAMALEYPDAEFVQNALVFAPGKTIIESLRELITVPYEKILPPRLHKPFAASVKITFTRDGEKDIPVVRGSSFNVVVTNTEKIRIQKETIRKRDLGTLLTRGEDEARAEVANLRLRAIASLPNLAVFSDEAHHTYGQSLRNELKKVRKTVDYLADNTRVVAVINTTGTPYFQKQPLRDVVVWYGLSQGIRENILKDVSDNIRSLELGEDASAFVDFVVTDFFSDYGGAALPNGAPARLAIYFPQIDDLEELRPVVDLALARAGLPPSVALRNTSQSTKEEEDAFNRLNDPASPYRVILLVNKGTEGWNCPSLFACALARRLRSSNNFVLQAATRCLRQVPGNSRKARIYLSRENEGILDRQLQETYGEAIADLSAAVRERRSARLVVRKPDPPPLQLTRIARTVAPSGAEQRSLALERPSESSNPALRVTRLDVSPQQGTRRLLQQVGEIVELESVANGWGCYEAAVSLAAEFRLDPWEVCDELRRLYPEKEIPEVDLPTLARQIGEQRGHYEVREEKLEWAVALVKPQGFTPEEGVDGQPLYVAEISYPKDRESLLLSATRLAKENPADFGFHYDPYNFDSRPELDFFQRVLRELNVHPAEVEDIYFTGGLTDPAKTDFFVEYRGDDGRWHRYTPDFVIRKRPRPGAKRGTGRVLIVEIKSAQFEAATREDELRFRRGEAPLTSEGRKAIELRKLERLNPEKLRYELIFVRTSIAYDQIALVRQFVREPEGLYGTDHEIAKRLCERVLATPGPRVLKVVLFGSRARGDARPDSDFDLLVVVDQIDPMDKEPYLLDLYRSLRQTEAVAEPWVVSQKEFEDSKTLVGSLAHPAWAEGVVLYEQP
jgi:predicted nucleotidyltransferase